MRVVVRAEQLGRLLHQGAVRLELFGLVVDQLRAVGEQVQVDRRRTAGIEFDALGVPPGVQRTVDQRLEVGALVAASARRCSLAVSSAVADCQPAGSRSVADTGICRAK